MATDASTAPASGSNRDTRVAACCPASDPALAGSHTPDLTRRRHVDFARVSDQACPGPEAR